MLKPKYINCVDFLGKAVLEGDPNLEILRQAVIAAPAADVVSREEYDEVVKTLEEARANARYFEREYYRCCGLGGEIRKYGENF